MTDIKRLKKLAAVYSTPQRRFAQVLLRRKLLPVQDVGRVFLEICELDEIFKITDVKPKDNKILLDLLVQTMNGQLPSIGLRMTLVADELFLNTEYVAIVSDRNFSEHLMSVSGLSSDEIGVFRIWLKMMFKPDLNETVDGEIHIGELKMHTALHCNSGKTNAAMMKTLKKLEEHDLISVDNERDLIRLHNRAIAELSASIQVEFDLPMCDLCNHVIFVRRLSEQCECEAQYHVRCLIKLLKDGKEVICPTRTCLIKFKRESLMAYEFEADDGGRPTTSVQNKQKRAAERLSQASTVKRRRAISGLTAKSNTQQVEIREVGNGDISMDSLSSEEDTNQEGRLSVANSELANSSAEVESSDEDRSD